MTAALGAQGCQWAGLQGRPPHVLQPRRVRCGSATATPSGRGRRTGDVPYPSTLEPASRQVQLVSRPPAQHEPLLTPEQARSLTNQIKACNQWEELQHLCNRSGRHFNHINLSAAITHMAQLQYDSTIPPPPFPSHTSRSRPDDDPPSTSYTQTPRSQRHTLPSGAALFMERLLQAAGHNMTGFGPRQLANMMWAVAKTGHRPRHAWLQSIVSCSGSLWGQYEAQHVANMAYALATIPHDPGRLWMDHLLQESLRLTGAFKPQELSNLLYAVSILCERQRLPAPRPWLQAMSARALELMEHFNGQELAIVAWATSRLAMQAGQQALLAAEGSGGGHGSWMYQLLAAAQQRLHARDLSPQGIACILLAAAGLQHRPPDTWLRHACLYSQDVLQAQSEHTEHAARVLQARRGRGAAPAEVEEYEGFGPQALSNFLLGLAQVGYVPPQACMAAFEAAAARCMRAALRRRRRPGGRRGSAGDALLPQHLGNLLWAMARMGWTPGSGFARLHLVCTASMAPSFSAMQMVQVLWSLSKLRIRLSSNWLELCCSQMLSSLGSLSGKEAVIALQALAWQRYTPSALWMQAMNRAVGPLLPAMPARRLAMYLYHSAVLRHRPSAQWAAAWAEAAAARTHEFGAVDAASALWAAQLLELALPEPLAAALLRRLCAQPGAVSPRQLARVAWALRAAHPAAADPQRRRQLEQLRSLLGAAGPEEVLAPHPAAAGSSSSIHSVTEHSHLLRGLTRWAAVSLL